MKPMKYEATAYSAPPIMEDNDCSVRALSVAAAMPYSDAYRLFEAHGRRRGRATNIRATRYVMIEIGAERVVGPVKKCENGPTVAQFTRGVGRNGRYVVHSGLHAFAIVDGVVHDWEDCRYSRPRCRVWAAWRMPQIVGTPPQRADNLEQGN